MPLRFATGWRVDQLHLLRLRMARIPTDRAIINLFVEYIRDAGQPNLKLDRWPEDENPGHSEIDAIAGDLLIQHTSVDTLADQRAVGKQFEDALGGLETLRVPFRLSMNVPYVLVAVGTDWNTLRLSLAPWIVRVAPGVPDGAHEVPLANTPLTCTALKDGSRTPGVFLSRPAPSDDTLPARVGARSAAS